MRLFLNIAGWVCGVAGLVLLALAFTPRDPHPTAPPCPCHHLPVTPGRALQPQPPDPYPVKQA